MPGQNKISNQQKLPDAQVGMGESVGKTFQNAYDNLKAEEDAKNKINSRLASGYVGIVDYVGFYDRNPKSTNCNSLVQIPISRHKDGSFYTRDTKGKDTPLLTKDFAKARKRVIALFNNDKLHDSKVCLSEKWVPKKASLKPSPTPVTALPSPVKSKVPENGKANPAPTSSKSPFSINGKPVGAAPVVQEKPVVSPTIASSEKPKTFTVVNGVAIVGNPKSKSSVVGCSGRYEVHSDDKDDANPEFIKKIRAQNAEFDKLGACDWIIKQPQK